MKIEPLSRLLSGFLSVFQHNTNADKIEAAFQNTLSRDGSSPNAMQTTLDMGSNRVINVGAPTNLNDAARLQDVVGGATINISNAWADITGKPSTFTPTAHTHVIADTTGLQTALDGKQASGSYAAASHSHVEADITSLVSDLAGKAASSHTHTTANVTGFDEQVRDVMGVALVAGSGMTVTVNDGADTITLTSTGGGGGGDMLKADNLSGLASIATSRTNLGLDTASTKATGFFATASHSHAVSDITAFGTGVGAVVAAGTGISLSTSSGVTTITNTVSAGSLSPPAVMTMTAKNSYQFGSLDPIVTGEPAKSWFNLGATGTSGANETVLCAQIVASGPDGTLLNKAAGLFQCVTTQGGTSGQFLTGAIPAGVGVYGSCFINGVTSGKFGSGWGACNETSVITGNDGFAVGSENGVHLQSSAQESSDPDAIHRLKVNVWCGVGRYGYRSTAILMNSPSAGNGSFYGTIFQDISNAHELWRNPGRSGCVGIDARSHANWGAIIHAPSVSSIRRWNSGNSATKNIMDWNDDTSSIAIGDTGDNIILYLSGLGQRVVTYGPTNSGGTGFRQLIVAN